MTDSTRMLLAGLIGGFGTGFAVAWFIADRVYWPMVEDAHARNEKTHEGWRRTIEQWADSNAKWKAHCREIEVTFTPPEVRKMSPEGRRHFSEVVRRLAKEVKEAGQ